MEWLRGNPETRNTGEGGVHGGKCCAELAGKKGSRDLHMDFFKLPSLQCQNIVEFLNDEADDLSRSPPQAAIPNPVFSRGI